MICPACQRENRDDARFCDRCSRPLAADVPRTPGAYTPRHLAERILTSRFALEGERKQVTVLFLDIVGSTELATRVDAEVWHTTLDRFFQLLADGVHRFEGTLNQFTGDGIMALFGAPLAHEDHAQRACHAALELGAELREFAEHTWRRDDLPFRVRTGLHSGEVIVGKIGDDLRMDYTAKGQTVALAARVEQLAEPGRIYVTDSTRRLVGEFFQLRDLGHSRVKGLSEPVRIWRLEAPGPLRRRIDAARKRGFSRLVGRARELATLETALAQALEGNGQVVGLVGEPGVGKSRLALEFLEGCRAQGIAVHAAHCPSHGRSVPLLPIRALLLDALGVEAGQADAAARTRVAQHLLELHPAFEPLLALVFEFLGIPDPERPAPPLAADLRRAHLTSFVRRLPQTRSPREPAVLWLDDLQWIDEESGAFLAELVEAMGWTRTLFLLSFRPEYRADWMGASYYSALPVAPLEAEAADALLGDDASLAPLVVRIRQATRGNPLFIEEVVADLAASGALEGGAGDRHMAAPAAEPKLPPSLQAVLSARIDRLPEAEKHLVGTAAVIGRRFALELLQRVAELDAAEVRSYLEALRSAGILAPADGSDDFEFKSPFLQEVAYGQQLGERRARTHVAVAQALEELYADRLGEQAALIAHHWQAAGRRRIARRWRHRAALGVSHIQIQRRRGSR